MKTLKILSHLLCYPHAALIEALDELGAVLEAEAVLPAPVRRRIDTLLAELAATDLYTLQEDYVNLFDRGRAVSLHLFEHVHGESRDRGQAMVDLIDLYRANGYERSARELPDYLPMLLEFLAERPPAQVRAILADAMPVIVLIGERLAQRQSRYGVLFEALQAFAGAPEDLAAIREQAASEGPDETLVDMDRFWEEEAVSFLGAGAPNGLPAGEQPIHWLKPEAGRATAPVGSSPFGPSLSGSASSKPLPSGPSPSGPSPSGPSPSGPSPSGPSSSASSSSGATPSGWSPSAPTASGRPAVPDAASKRGAARHSVLGGGV